MIQSLFFLLQSPGLWTVLLGTQRKLPGRKEATYPHSAFVWGFPNTWLIISSFLIFKVFLEIGCSRVFLPLFSLPSCPEVCSFSGDNSLNDRGHLKKVPCASRLSMSHAEAPRHKQFWHALNQLHLCWWCFCWDVCRLLPFSLQWKNRICLLEMYCLHFEQGICTTWDFLGTSG